MQIVKSKPSDASTLTKIAKISKKYWNYSDEQIEKWKDELTVTKKEIKRDIIFHILINEKIVGFYSLSVDKEKAEIEHMWILPEYIGKGLGRKLFNHMKGVAKNKDVKKLRIVADPNAEGFYTKMGFKRVGEKESSIKGRMLPILTLEIK